jgi:DNA-binding IclR family transcriptional regulator
LFELYGGVRLVALTEQTPTTLEAQASRVARAAAGGQVVSRGSVEPGGISISAAVRDDGEELVG